MIYRKYNPKRDKKAVHNIWKEVGWIEGNDYKPMDMLIEKSRTIVADVNKRPECLVVSWLGDMIYQKSKVKFSCVAGVTTSLVARKQKLAGRLTSEKIALDAVDGAELCGLGMFEQGYYNQLGFGNGSIEHYFYFSPASLNVDVHPRVPIRLDKKDWKRVHESRLKRIRLHGSCVSDTSAPTRAELMWATKGCGFGFEDKKGELTHFVWMNGKGREHGPMNVWIMSYQTYDQFLELLALMKSFGEQIHQMYLDQPPNIHFQDFLDKPFKHRQITEKSKYENKMQAVTWWQMRILDLKKCIAKTKLECDDIKFNLKLYDPIERFLDDNAPWRGISGEYTVTFGKKSSVKKGFTKNLPLMDADVGAFTRLWMGCLNASSLAVSDVFAAPKSLIEKLDKGLSILPVPHPDWPF